MLGHFVERYLRARVRRGEITARTARGQRGTLHSFAAAFGDRPVGRLGAGDVLRWLERYADHAPGTRRLAFSTVRGFCGWLVAEGHVRRDPTAGMRSPKEPRTLPRALSASEVSALLAAAQDQRDRLMVVLGVQLGLRIAEMARLEIGDIDFTHRLVRVVGKGSHERILYVPDEALDEIRRYMGQVGAVRGPLLRNHRRPHEGLRPDTIGGAFRRLFYESGVKAGPGDGKSAHSCRHTALSDMLRHGAHVRDVQAVAGHRMLATTETYLPLLVGTMEEAMEGRRYLEGVPG